MFKVGSKVKCVRPRGGLVAGGMYTVSATKRENGKDFVRLSSPNKQFYFCDRFVQVNVFKGNIK